MGTATVELVPCYESGTGLTTSARSGCAVSSGRLSLYDGDGAAYEINEALPFGPWTPGGPGRDRHRLPGHDRLRWRQDPQRPSVVVGRAHQPCITTIDLKENAA